MPVKLKPCPFCGHKEPSIERMGDRRQSCIVICGWCGCRHESSDEGKVTSWNQREPDDAEARKNARLRKVCDAFIAKQDITCGETIYQTDRVIENAYEFIEAVCKVVGYAKRKDDDE